MDPLELDELKHQKRHRHFPMMSSLVAAVLGGVTAFALFVSLTGNEVPPKPSIGVPETINLRTPEIEKVLTVPVPASEELPYSSVEPPLVASKPESVLAPAFGQSHVTTPLSYARPAFTMPVTAVQSNEEETSKRKEIKLSGRWTVLALIPDGMGEAPLPEKLNIWNYEKGYSFKGTRLNQHVLADYWVDGEFILRDGYIVREFGNSALLHLPQAEDFELEGLIKLNGTGGWLMLVGWDIESKSGYVVYNTVLRTSGSQWKIVEIKDGKAVTNSHRHIVKRDANGEGALRVLVDKGKISLQAAGAYVFKDEELPNYQEGHVAIGTFSPAYGPRNLAIKSLRMRLR